MANYGLGFREKYDTGFVQIKNEMFGDQRLSFKAKGILGYLLSKPDGWKVINKDLQNHAKDGRESIDSGLKELKDMGYLVFHRTKKPDGTWGTPIYRYSDRPFFDPAEKPEIIKVPFDDEELAKRALKDHNTGNPFVDENLDTTDSDHKRETRIAENRVTGNAVTEKPYDISNKDFTKKDSSNINTKTTTRTNTKKTSKDLVSSSDEILMIDKTFQEIYKDAPLEEIKAKLFEDAESGKIKMKTEAQYFALVAKRIQFHLDALHNTPEKPTTAQIDEITPEVGQIPLEQRSREFKAFLRQSGEVTNDSEPSSEGSTDSEPNSETFETRSEKTPEEIAEAQKEVRRLMELRNKNK
jgi:hypothetical protein